MNPCPVPCANTAAASFNKIDLRRLLSPDKAILPFIERKGNEGLSPYSVELHLTSHCNHSCYHCSYQSRRSGNAAVETKHMQRLVEDIISMGVEGVYWSGGGEPTTIRNMPEYMNELSKANIHQALVTNGIMLKDRLIPQLKRLNYIACSFVAASSETYRRITGCDNRDAFYWNMRHLRNILDQTILGARCIINKFNYREIAQIYRDSRDLGFDYIIFIPAVDYEKRGDVELNAEEKRILMDEAQRMSHLLDPSYTNLLDIVENNMSYYSEEESDSHACYANNIRATVFINYDGGVWLCQPHIGDKRYSIGNIRNQRFSEMWNGKRHVELLKTLDKEYSLGICKNCRSIKYNEAIHRFKKENSGERFFDPFL